VFCLPVRAVKLETHADTLVPLCWAYSYIPTLDRTKKAVCGVCTILGIGREKQCIPIALHSRPRLQIDRMTNELRYNLT
jgi:hypothetical protein